MEIGSASTKQHCPLLIQIIACIVSIVFITDFWWPSSLLTQTNGRPLRKSIIGPQNSQPQMSIMNELAQYCNAKDDSLTLKHRC